MISNPRLSTMQVLHSEFVLGFKGRESFFKMRNHQWIYLFWRLGRNEAGKKRGKKSADSMRTIYMLDIPDTEFTRYFSRDDCLCTRSAECTFDSMDR